MIIEKETKQTSNMKISTSHPLIKMLLLWVNLIMISLIIWMWKMILVG